MPKNLQTKVIKEYITRFPNTTNRSLAVKIYKENKELFRDSEDVRDKIRYHKGAHGEKHRESIIKVDIKSSPTWYLEESHAKKTEVFKLPKSIKKVLLLSDIHFPFHDVKALKAALNDGLDEKVDAIFINGDLLDFYQLSFHEKDPRKTSIPEELEMCRNFFKELKKNFKSTKIYYIPGNHEYRLERYLRLKAPELLDVEEFRLDVLLRVREFGVEYIPYGTKCYFGKLLVEHGDKMKGSGGVNPARTLSLKFKRHAICGHFHRTSECLSKVYDDSSFATYSTGCLCELEPSYMPVNEHNHGFAIVKVNGDEFVVKNKKIVNGKVY